MEKQNSPGYKLTPRDRKVIHRTVERKLKAGYRKTRCKSIRLSNQGVNVSGKMVR